MKNVWKNTGLAIIAISGVMLGSCTRKTNDVRNAEQKNDQKFQGIKQDDADFVVNAVAANYSEIRLAELAKQKATMQKTKDFADTLISDHTRANSEIRALALSKNISVPSGPNQDALNEYDKLNGMQGDQFDKEFADYMVKDHQKAIDMFQHAVDHVQDGEIRDWAQKTLPVLRHHLQMAQDCRQMKSGGMSFLDMQGFNDVLQSSD